MHNKLLISGWVVVLAWGAYAAFNFFTYRWDGLAIALTGLVASLFVVGAFQSRSNKDPYGRHTH
jgi:VIT1/CCC1 family predicted Fe2+/Mn2+ transporter